MRQFRPIPFAPDYTISSDGIVRGVVRGRLLKPFRGFVLLSLADGRRVCRTIRSLVRETYGVAADDRERLVRMIAALHNIPLDEARREWTAFCEHLKRDDAAITKRATKRGAREKGAR